MQKHVALKLLAIFIVGLMVLIPISMVKFKVYERQGYMDEARFSVAQSWTGQQKLLTPIIVLPYVIKQVETSAFVTATGSPVESVKEEVFYAVIQPDKLDNITDVKNKSIFKGIYEIPVYDSQIKLKGVFSQGNINESLNRIKQVAHFHRLGQPFIATHISDVRGIDAVPVITLNGSEISVEPGSRIVGLEEGVHSELDVSTLSAGEIDFSFSLSLRGMGALAFVPVADASITKLASNWPHPEFVGISLPKDREITAQGFSATWTSSRYSSSGAELVERCITSRRCEDLMSNSSGVNFIQPVDIYVQSERSIKYALLFVGLIFTAFFIFETMTPHKIHPIQYAFVGLAVSVFYLLLISLAEHIAFAWAYFGGVLSCAGLLLFYVRYLFRSLKYSVIFSAMLVSLFSLLYVIVQAEDFALLMGAVLVFSVLATLMAVTRNVDWYGSSREAEDLRGEQKQKSLGF